MTTSTAVVRATLASLAFVALFAGVTWNFVFGPIDRVMVLMFFGIGSVGGQ